ncbi:ribonuclease H-like domain-containing protein [Tanacetum coccineum]
MASQDARLSKFEADFKQQQSEMTNKIDTVLKAITDRIAGTLPSDTVKNLKLGTHPVSSAPPWDDGILYEHQLKFNSIKDAKLLLEAIEKRFGGNAATKKTERNLLNKHELETMSMDDLYNNLKVYEPEVKRTSSSSTSTQNMAFVSSNNSGSTNEVVNTAHGDSTASTQANAANPINDLEEMDLRGQIAMLSMRVRRFLKNTRRKVTINGNETIRFDKSKVECYNFHKRGHFARECRVPRNQDNRIRESSRRSVPVETTTSNALISCDGLGGYDWILILRYHNDFTCSKSFLETVEVLKSQYEQLLKRFEKSELMVVAYKTGLQYKSKCYADQARKSDKLAKSTFCYHFGADPHFQDPRVLKMRITNPSSDDERSTNNGLMLLANDVNDVGGKTSIEF